jgi:hypothetical protein
MILPSFARHLSSVLIVGLFAGCAGEMLESAKTVSKLRILAVRAEPPDLAPGETVTLDALVVDPRHDRCIEPVGAGSGAPADCTSPAVVGSPTLYWELCLFDEGANNLYRCGTIPDLPSEVSRRDLGTGATASIAYNAIVPAPSFIEQACSQLASADLPDFVELPSCRRGLPVTIRLTAIAAGADLAGRTTDQFCLDEPADCEIAKKSLTLLLPDKVAERNSNPRIEALSNGETELEPGVAIVPVCGDDSVPGEEDYDHHDPRVVPLVAAVTVGEGSGSSAELFNPEPSQVDAAPAPKREALEIAWYTTFGDIRGSTYWGEDVTTDDEITLNQLEFKQHMKEFGLTALPAGPVRIFAVIRDGRGGVDFLERELSIPFISGAEEAVSEDQKCFDVKGVAK